MNALSPAVGATVSRIALGIVMLAHSAYLKLFIFTLPGTAQFFVSLGLPAVLAYAVFAIETVAGILLIIGWRVRWASLALIPVLLGATWAHLEAGWLFNNEGGGWEYPLYLAVMATAQMFLGAGRWSLDEARASSSLPGQPTMQRG